MEAHGLRPALGDNRCRGQPPARKLVRYLRKGQMRKKNIKFWTEPRPCMVLGLKPMGKRSTKLLLLQVLDRTKALYGPRTQAYGETKYKNFYYYKFWTEPRYCMVLGPKPMGKPSTKILIITSFGQNQGLVWSSDPSLWGNQVQKFLLL